MAKNKERSTDKTPFSVKLPPELLEQARRKSADTGISISFVIRKAVADWVKSEPSEALLVSGQVS